MANASFCNQAKINQDLLEAARTGNEAKVDHSLGFGADVNYEDWKKQTPLHLAAKNGHNDIILKLIRKGANINKKASSGYTPLVEAVSNRRHETAKLLLRHRADVMARTNKGLTPLHWAAMTEMTDIMYSLIMSSAEVNAVDNQKQTPLHRACATSPGNESVVHILLANDADTSVKNEKGFTPAELAKKNNNFNLAEILENLDPDKDKDGDIETASVVSHLIEKESTSKKQDLFDMSFRTHDLETGVSGTSLMKASDRSHKDKGKQCFKVRKDSMIAVLEEELEVPGIRGAQCPVSPNERPRRKQQHEQISLESTSKKQDLFDMSFPTHDLETGVSRTSVMKASDRSHKDKDTRICRICYDENNPVDIAFKPCFHVVCCKECAKRIVRDNGACPICRKSITSLVRLYF